MACVLRRSRHEVTLWAREPEVVESINARHVNELFLSSVPLFRFVSINFITQDDQSGFDVAMNEQKTRARASWKGSGDKSVQEIYGRIASDLQTTFRGYEALTLEARIAPKFYRRTPIVTLSDSSKRDLVEDLGFADRMVHVVPPGIDPRFTPGGVRSDRPLVVAVGRLVPVKRFEVLIPILVELKRRVPDLEAVIVGEGYRREDLEAMVAEAGAQEWLTLPGRIGDDALVDLYRRAWVLASVSSGEGWGMTITEAAACATPAVATRITGHVDAIVEGTTGLLGDGPDEVTDALERVLRDPDLRRRLSDAAQRHAERFTWDATALGTLSVLAADAVRRRGPAAT